MKSIRALIVGTVFVAFVGSAYAITTTLNSDTNPSQYAPTYSTPNADFVTPTADTPTISTNTDTDTDTPTGPKNTYGTFIFNPRTRIWDAYSPDGTLVRSGYGSGGSNYCRDLHRRCHTPVGIFHVYGKGNASCKSSKFPIDRPGAPMPWCMYFYHGFAVHGSYEVRNYNASHGCIRIQPADAYWLSHNLIQIGSVIIVKPY